jgi:Domain of unknown function (DUF4260)
MKFLSPKLLLHLEGAFVFLTACILYAHFHFSWWVFALFILAPDVSMLAYLVNKRAGTLCYNLFHTYSITLLVFLVLLCLGKTEDDWIVLIWVAHIGIDRLLGYGIKYETGFKDTHFQRL